MVVDRGGPLRNNVYDYSFAELFNLYRKAIKPEIQVSLRALRDGQIIP